eukprot:3067102-Amphidinium_carterae.2
MVLCLAVGPRLARFAICHRSEFPEHGRRIPSTLRRFENVKMSRNFKWVCCWILSIALRPQEVAAAVEKQHVCCVQ